MSDHRVILSDSQFELTIKRLAHQLIENYDDFSNTSIIGIQETGVYTANRIVQVLEDLGISVEFGKLDITFYRDDYRLRSEPLKASSTEIDFSLDGKRVILVDDVLYTGRTIHAAMSALQDIGRSSHVELVTMVDRRFNRHLPIKADYVGLTVDALEEAYVRVKWKDIDGADEILFFESNKQ